jgi:exodeoxyribonuclease V alpha subunit
LNKNKENNKNIIEFTCQIDREVYNSPDYKIYGVIVDKEKFPNLLYNQYGNVTIVGNIHDLQNGVTYHVKVKEVVHKKRGKQYEVINIKRDKPNNQAETKRFLYEILTHQQAETLLEAYPNIVDKIIKNDLDDVNLNLTKGIKEKTFEVIKRKVIDNFCLVDITEKYGGYGISLSMFKKLYDKYASVEKLEEELKKDPYKSLCGISGVGFTTADKIILSIPNEILEIDFDLKCSKQRMLSCILYLLEENEGEGNTKIEVKSLREQCKKLTPECIEYFVEIIKNNEDIYFDNTTKFISTKKAYETEKYISETIHAMLDSPRVYKFNWEYYNEIDGNKLTEQQLNALKNLCENNISLVSGYAGSGKSFTTQSIIRMLEDNGLTYKLMSPTGKAAKVLSSYTNRIATTIHRGLNYNPSLGWGYNKYNKLECDVIIGDEWGMVDIYLQKRLFEAIDISKTKVIFIQDPAQIPSVSSGNCSDNMIQSGIIPCTTLDKIFRYGEGGLYNVATKVRNGEYYIENESKVVQNFGTNKDYCLINLPQDKLTSGVIDLYEKLLQQGNTINDIMVLTHHNKGNFGSKVINNLIQERINPKENKKWIKHKDGYFVEGDKVLQIVNNYKAKSPYGHETEVMNGNTGIITNVTYNRIIVDFNGELIMYDQEELNQLLLGYVISMHRSQGDSAKIVIILTPDSHTFFITRNLLYTAITRTKQMCYHFTNPKLIKSSLKKSATKDRKTFLRELLLNQDIKGCANNEE